MPILTSLFPSINKKSAIVVLVYVTSLLLIGNNLTLAASFKLLDEAESNKVIATLKQTKIPKAMITPLAGSGVEGDEDGFGSVATFNGPSNVATDGHNLYVTDSSNNKIRQINIATAKVTTLAGSGEDGASDGIGLTATFKYPKGITCDGKNLYVTDSWNNKIRKIVIATAVVTTLAGSGAEGDADGVGKKASFSSPEGITNDGSNLYVADTKNNKIRKIVIDNGAVTTLAGSVQGEEDGIGTKASFYGPSGITIYGEILYVTDTINGKIRLIDLNTMKVSSLNELIYRDSKEDTKTVSTFHLLDDITTDGNNLYVTDSGNHTIQKIVIATKMVEVLAGAGAPGWGDAADPENPPFSPVGILLSNRKLFVVDDKKHSISFLEDFTKADCSALLGMKRNEKFEEYLTTIMRQAAGGDLDSGILYAAAMHDRFSCMEAEILNAGKSTSIEIDTKKSVEAPGKIIPSIASLPKALDALNDVMTAYTNIANHDLNARNMLGQYYFRYNAILAKPQTGYLLLAEADKILCGFENITKPLYHQCLPMKIILNGYNDLLDINSRKKLDKEALKWAINYLNTVVIDEYRDISDLDQNRGASYLSAIHKGTDFELSLWRGGEEGKVYSFYTKLRIYMQSGEPVTEYINDDGSIANLNSTNFGPINFGPIDSLELKKIIPGSAREQLITKGSQWHTRGEGSDSDYKIYSIDISGVRRLLSVQTGRHFEGIGNRDPVEFEASVKEKIKNGKPVIEYSYNTEKGKERMITFTWNGSKFVDLSGEYKKVRKQYFEH